MPFSTTALNQALDALNGGSPSSIIAYASLHTAFDPGGANEVAGGSPAYARQAVTWNAAAGESKASSSVAGAFNIPAGTSVVFVGLWSAVSSGTFAGMGPAGAGTQYGFTCTSASPGVLTAPGSAYSNGQTVVLFDGAGATIPSAYAVGTVYYVVSASGSAFSLSATSGGSAINTANTGAGIVQAVTVETFSGQGTYILTSESLQFT